MSIHNYASQNIRRASAQSAQASMLPSPTKGIDVRQNLATADPETCVYAYNMNAAEYGMQTRSGYKEWQVNVSQGGSFGVRTMIPFAGQPVDKSDDRLFAVTNEGIWDVTQEGVAPNLKIGFPDRGVTAGYGVYTHYTNDAGREIVFYADAANGLYKYSAETQIWEPETTITGVTPANVVFVVAHKQRIWMCERNSATGWYLGIGAVSGEAKPFYFGSKFKHGGDLVGLYNWTVDGGVGLDDHLVAVSRGGDVMPYKGTDPESTGAGEWENIGTYFIGEVPAGNRVGSEYGGDLNLLSVFGVTSMSDLLQGVQAQDVVRSSLAYKIASLVRADIKQRGSLYGWEIKYLAGEGLFMIKTPETADMSIQYVLNLTTNGWTIWRGVPIAAVDVWQGATVFGTADSRICRMDVPRDNVLLNDASSGTDVEFSILFTAIDLGTPAQFKRVELVRPMFLAGAPPKFETKVFYDYNTGFPLPPSGVATSNPSSWDVGRWDDAVWGQGVIESTSEPRGAQGIGREVSVAIRGRSIAENILVSTDVIWRTGGVL